jgi:hypothetical protein
MSMTWIISVGGRSYGPYALEQMQAFQSEGRLAPHSLIARDGETQFRYASEDGDLAALFVSRQPQDSETRPSEAQPVTFGRDAQVTGERTRYIIIAEMKSGSISTLEEEIFNFGLAFRFMPQSWILTSEVSLNTLRGELIQKLGKLDTLIVVDTTHDKAAWFNFGPESDAKMRRMWQRESVAARAQA